MLDASSSPLVKSGGGKLIKSLQTSGYRVKIETGMKEKMPGLACKKHEASCVSHFFSFAGFRVSGHELPTSRTC
jgi:hypothetical protein